MGRLCEDARFMHKIFRKYGQSIWTRERLIPNIVGSSRLRRKSRGNTVQTSTVKGTGQMVQGGGFEDEQGFRSGSLGSGAIRDDFGPNDACGVCLVLVYRFAEGGRSGSQLVQFN